MTQIFPMACSLSEGSLFAVSQDCYIVLGLEIDIFSEIFICLINMKVIKGCKTFFFFENVKSRTPAALL